jgi:hypothetical protein
MVSINGGVGRFLPMVMVVERGDVQVPVLERLTNYNL